MGDEKLDEAGGAAAAVALAGEHVEPPPTPPADRPERLPPAPARPHLHLGVVHLDAPMARTVKIGPGLLRRVVVNTAPAGMNGVLTVRDGVEGGGAVLAVITPVAGGPLVLDYDCPFLKGLWLSLVGATPGDWAVVWE
jgi:hypothetical protein